MNTIQFEELVKEIIGLNPKQIDMLGAFIAGMKFPYEAYVIECFMEGLKMKEKRGW